MVTPSSHKGWQRYICANNAKHQICLGQIRSVSLWLSYQGPIRVPLLPIRATCPAHLILLDLIIPTILGEVYESQLR
jgi:hypothetical protein